MGWANCRIRPGPGHHDDIIMKIFVTGNLGYIGSVLVPTLKQNGHRVTGLDTGYYEECVLAPAEAPHEQIRKDVRDICLDDVQGVDAVVHLAALSNDPLGELKPELTEEINRDATISVAALAKQAGVKRFVYASSQSMYGVSETDAELDEDNSEKHPITSYARTKWEAECRLKTLAGDDFTVVCLRPSTVFGASPRLRCDIVYNNLVGCAYATGKIEIKSDGTPWRPVVHIRDVASAFHAALIAPTAIVASRSFNVGIPDGNYTVRQLAEAAQRSVPGCELHFTGEHGGDSRTYRVGFSRILTELRDYFRPEWDLDRGGKELVQFFQKVGFTEETFRGRICTRLLQLKHLIQSGKLDDNLRWKGGGL